MESLRCLKLSVRGALVLVGVMGVLGGAACASSPAPTPVLRPSAPAPVVPATPAPVASVTRYTVPMLVTDTRYRVDSKASIERDSAGRRETQQLTTRADVLVRQRRQSNGALSASGQISGYSVSSPFTSAPTVIDSLRFEAVLDAQALRVVSQPPLANECDRPEGGALSLVRDLFVRVPSVVAVGDQWRDSTVQLVCRSSIPMVMRTTADYQVVDTARSSDGVVLVIRRTSTTRLDGKVASPWRALEVTGTGTATLEIRVAVLTGAVRVMEGSSTLTLSVTDKTASTAVRAQQVTQRVSLRAQATSN